MKHYEQAVRFAQDLIKINTVETPSVAGMPFGEGNAEALQFALETMQNMGFSTKNLDNYCGYAEVGAGELFGILCHLDVVPVSDNWSVDPFGGIIKDNRLYGRGAVDDKGAFSATLFAIKKLLEEGYTPKKRIRFILGCDEESGWKCMEEYAKREELPAMGIAPDADFPVINCEKGILHISLKTEIPAGLVAFSSGTRTNVVPDYATATIVQNKMVESLAKMGGLKTSVDGDHLTLTATGKSAHASTPEEGKNALIALLGALGLAHPTYNRLYADFCESDGRGINLDVSDENSGNLTLNLATACIENGKLCFTLDIRHPICITAEEILKTISQDFKGFEVTILNEQKPLFVAKDHPLVSTLLEAYNSIMDTNATPITIGGGTYARALPLGVAFGPSFPNSISTVHQDDEYVELADFYKSIDIYYTAFKKLLF